MMPRVSLVADRLRECARRSVAGEFTRAVATILSQGERQVVSSVAGRTRRRRRGFGARKGREAMETIPRNRKPTLEGRRKGVVGREGRVFVVSQKAWWALVTTKPRRREPPQTDAAVVERGSGASRDKGGFEAAAASERVEYGVRNRSKNWETRDERRRPGDAKQRE